MSYAMKNAAAAPLPPPTQEIELKSETRPAGPQPDDLVELFQFNHARLFSAHYTIFNKRFLSVHRKRFMHKAERHWIDLSVLDPTPHLLTVIDRRWLYAAAGLTLATAILIAASLISQTPWREQMWMPATVLLLNAALVSFVIFFQRSRSLVRFQSRHGEAVLLELVNNLPSRDEFRDFIRLLMQRIHALHRANPHKSHRRLGAELVEHRRLFEAGILDRDAYDQAREKILRMHRQASTRQQVPAKVTATTKQRMVGNAEIIEITLAEDVRRGGSEQAPRKPANENEARKVAQA